MIRRRFVAVLAALLALPVLFSCAAPSPAAIPPAVAAPSAAPAPTRAPAPTASPVPDLPEVLMAESDVETTRLGKAAAVISPFYPWNGDVNPTQTEYLFGEESFPTVFVFCQGGSVIHVSDYRSVSRPEAPYVGMPEEWIHCTGLGELKQTLESSYFAGGELHIRRYYVLRDKDDLYFSVTAYNGFVSEIKDYRDDPSPGLQGPLVLPGSGTYDNPEDFWLDNMDEFEDYDEAAEYWQEEYGGSVF